MTRWITPGVIAAFVLSWLALVTLPAWGHGEPYDSHLVLVVDVSGSVTDAEYEVQRSGYVEVLLDPMVASALDRTAVAIVEFATTAVVTVAWMDVRGAATVYRVSKRPFQGSTCIACGLEAALQLLDGTSGKRVIDISGDGIDNVRPGAVATLVDLATLKGVEVNTLALLVEPDATTLVGGCSGKCLEGWYAELATGFAMAITAMVDLQGALRRKLFLEISGYDPQSRS